MISSNNFNIMNDSDKLESSLENSKLFTMRFNVEFLNGCEYNCAGCFVNRRNIITDNDYLVLLDLVTKLRTTDIHIDEIILGPTDFFVADNTIDVLINPHFRKLFKSKTVLTLLSTLQSTDDSMLAKISILNKYYDDIEVELLIPIDPLKIFDKDYTENLKHKISLLNYIKFDVDYAFQINISKLEDIDLVKLTNYIQEEFNTILEFNPSIMRIKNIDKVVSFLDEWNNMLSSNIDKINKNSILLSSANKYHAGYNERTYTYKNGFLYACPFIYENVVSLSNSFKIEKSNELYNVNEILEFDTNLTTQQFKYASKTDICENCTHLSSCISKEVLFYMKNNNIKKCIINRDILEIHDINN